MLPEIAAEALRFLGRRDLDQMCVTSKWLEALASATCEEYPFRPMHRVSLETELHDVFDDDEDEVHGAFDTLDEALIFLALAFRRTYADEFQVHLDLSEWNYRLSPRQWTDLTNIFRTGTTRHLGLRHVDLSVLEDSAFEYDMRCRKLKVFFCDIRGGLLTDNVLRACATNGVLEFAVYANNSEDKLAVTEDGLLEFCFPQGAPSRGVQVDNLTASDTFALNFVERLLSPSCTSRPRGFLVFTNKTEQLCLAAYTQHLLQDQSNLTYRFATGTARTTSSSITTTGSTATHSLTDKWSFASDISIALL